MVLPVRPRVASQPFTTQLVLNRNDSRWNDSLAQRYYLYPVHVSLSFLLTRGMETALYLLLMRLLHRDYQQVQHRPAYTANTPTCISVMSVELTTGMFHELIPF